MKVEDELERLFQAERSSAPPASSAERGLLRLTSALAAGAVPLNVSAAALEIGKGGAAAWGAAGTAMLVLGTAGALAVQTSAAPPRTVSPPLAAQSAPVSRLPVDTPPVAKVLPPPLPSASVVRPSAQRSSVPSASAAPSFEEELRLIELAKVELDARRAERATALLDEHRARFPRGAFATERDALAVLIACQTRSPGSTGRAQAFRERHPGSPLIDRIFRACGLAVAPPQPIPTSTPTAAFPIESGEIEK